MHVLQGAQALLATWTGRSPNSGTLNPQGPNGLGIAFCTLQVKKMSPRVSGTDVRALRGGAKLPLLGTPGCRQWIPWSGCWTWPVLSDAGA